MNLAIDLIGTNLGSGTRTYNVNFLKQLLQSDQKEQIYIFACNDYLNDTVVKNLPKNVSLKKKSNFLKINFIKIIWMQFIFPIELKMLNIQKLFSPMNYCPVFCRIMKIKIILGIHSNLPWVLFNKMPGSRYKNYLIKKFMELSIKFCDKLIVNSNFAKKEIINYLKLKDEKINVVYLGADNQINAKKTKNENLQQFDYKSKYILCVSSCVRYHDFINILKSFKNIIHDDKKNLKLVFVSQVLDKKYFKEIKKYVSKNFTKNEIIFLKNLNENNLKKLYTNALFYVFSSYCEVFGLTTLEAMLNECPVLVSRSSALQEINSDSALYFDPDNQSEIREKMLELINNSNLRKSLIIKGSNHVKNFKWLNTYERTMKIILK